MQKLKVVIKYNKNMADQLSKFRANMYNKRLNNNDKSGLGGDSRKFLHSVIASIMARGVILGPLERIKLI